MIFSFHFCNLCVISNLNLKSNKNIWGYKLRATSLFNAKAKEKWSTGSLFHATISFKKYDRALKEWTATQPVICKEFKNSLISLLFIIFLLKANLLLLKELGPVSLNHFSTFFEKSILSVSVSWVLVNLRKFRLLIQRSHSSQLLLQVSLEPQGILAVAQPFATRQWRRKGWRT